MNSESTKVIVSLTSYPPRIKTVDQVIRSLLAQTVKPWKIILWLANKEFSEGETSLPAGLVNVTLGTNFNFHG